MANRKVDYRGAISRLTPLTQGMSFTNALTTQRINDIQDAILAIANGENIRQGSNTRISRGNGFFQIHASRSDTTLGYIPPLEDFEVMLEKDKDGWWAGCRYASYVLMSSGGGDTDFDTWLECGATLADMNPAENDPNWWRVKDGDYGWIEIDLTADDTTGLLYVDNPDEDIYFQFTQGGNTNGKQATWGGGEYEYVKSKDDAGGTIYTLGKIRKRMVFFQKTNTGGDFSKEPTQDSSSNQAYGLEAVTMSKGMQVLLSGPTVIAYDEKGENPQPVVGMMILRN